MAKTPRPAYEKEVDRDLFGYCDALKAIEHHKTKVMQMVWADTKYMTRLTSVLDGVNSQQMPLCISAEADIKAIEREQKLLQANEAYVDSIIDGIAYAFQGAPNLPEIKKFIELYWWAYPRTSIRVRKDVVIGNMPFLKDRRTKEGYIYKPFYDFRERVYIRLAEVWGYMPAHSRAGKIK